MRRKRGTSDFCLSVLVIDRLTRMVGNFFAVGVESDNAEKDSNEAEGV